MQGDDLVARRLARPAAAAQAHLATTVRARRDLQLHVAGQRRHRHCRTQRHFPGCHRQIEQDITPFQPEARVFAQTDFENQVARRATASTGIALSRQADLLAGGDSSRNLDFERALAAAIAQAEALTPTCVGRGEIDTHLRVQIAAFTWTRASAAFAVAEQRFEEIAVVLVAARTALVALPVRRRAAEFVAAAITAGARLIVSLAARGLLERLIGLVDRLEFLLGTAHLADVRVVLAREAPIRRLYFRIGRARLYAESVVVVLELHPLPRTFQTTRSAVEPPRAGFILTGTQARGQRCNALALA